MIIVAIIVGTFVVVFIAGVVISNRSRPRTRAEGTVQRSEDCAEACTAWDNARQELCNAKSDEETVRARADAKRGELLAALALAATLAGTAAGLAAAASATAATIFGIPASAVLWTLAAAAAAVAAIAVLAATFLAGELVALENDFAAKSDLRSSWESVVSESRAAVNSLCSQEEANECLSRTAPC